MNVELAHAGEGVEDGEEVNDRSSPKVQTTVGLFNRLTPSPA